MQKECKKFLRAFLYFMGCVGFCENEIEFLCKTDKNTPPEKSGGVLILYSRYRVFTLRTLRDGSALFRDPRKAAL